jgi:glycosyltransferase involved in cell wall biosynthesis
MIELWDISPERNTAIPLGVSPEIQVYNLTEEEKQVIYKKYKLPSKPFILFVGALEPHKNIKNIILAYHKLPEALRKQYQLVLVGKETPYCQGYKDQIISLGLSDNVSFVDYIEPSSLDLAYIYNMAEVFVFPTFYEGWASPPLEAMKSGTPTVVADIPSLRESTGGISLYPDPHNPDEIVNNIQKLLEDKNLHKKQKTRGMEFVQQYTWKHCAEKTLALYERLLNK